MYTPNLYTAKQDSMSLSTSYRALVTYSNSSTGEIRVKIPALLGADSEVTISEWGRSPINGTWIVPSVGSKIVVTADDAQLTNVFWVQTDIAITTNNVVNGTIVAGDLATSVLKLVCPVGTIAPYAGATAPTGWLLCNGGSISATYTELRALVGATTPNLAGKVLVMKGSAPFDGALLTSFGSTTSTALHSHVVTMTTTPSGSLTTALPQAGAGIIATASNSSTATSGESSVGTAHGNVQPSTIVNYIIKHDY